MGERYVRNVQVRGSIPLISTIFIFDSRYWVAGQEKGAGVEKGWRG
jgi:hypothetical protein